MRTPRQRQTDIQVGDVFAFMGIYGQRNISEDSPYLVRIEVITVWGDLYFEESPDGDKPFTGLGYQGASRCIPYDRAVKLIEDEIWQHVIQHGNNEWVRT